MPLAALLSATIHASDRPDQLRAQILFATQPLIEYQARQAIQAGADHIFIMVEALVPALSRLVDHLGGKDVEVHLVRDMAGLMRQLPPESDVLLFAEGMVVDQRYVAALAAEPGNAVLVAEDGAATSHLERIDNLHRWAGVARIAPTLLFNTLDLIGDWDLMLTLFRAVVQNEPRRIEVAEADIAEGRVALVDRQETADLVGRSLATPEEDADETGGVERYLLRPPARMLATQLLRMQIPVLHLRLMAVGIALLGLFAIGPGMAVLGLLLFLAALCVDLAANHVALAGRMPLAGDRTRWMAPLAVLLGLVWLGYREAALGDGLDLALIGAITLVALEKGKARGLPGWMLMTPGSAAALLLVAMLLGFAGPALAIAGALGIVSLGALLLWPRDGGLAGVR